MALLGGRSSYSCGPAPLLRPSCQVDRGKLSPREGSGSRIHEFIPPALPGAEGEVRTGSCCLWIPLAGLGLGRGLRSSAWAQEGRREGPAGVEKNQERSWFQVGPWIRGKDQERSLTGHGEVRCHSGAGKPSRFIDSQPPGF